jgi:uncharacterized protein
MAVKDFSVEERLVSLITVQKIESKIDEINKLRGELPMEVKDLEDELEGLNTRKDSILNEVSKIESFIEQKKQLQADAKDLLSKYSKQSGNVKNNREFEAINKEIELQELEIQACDKQIRDAHEDIKELQVKIEEVDQRLAAKEEVLGAKKVELEKIISETEKEEKILIDQATKAKEAAEPRLLAAYERLRGNYQNGLGVVSVERNSCGGCFNVIPPQRQADIRLRKKVIICEHCGRVLTDLELYQGVNI